MSYGTYPVQVWGPGGCEILVGFVLQKMARKNVSHFFTPRGVFLTGEKNGSGKRQPFIHRAKEFKNAILQQRHPFQTSNSYKLCSLIQYRIKLLCTKMSDDGNEHDDEDFQDCLEEGDEEYEDAQENVEGSPFGKSVFSQWLQR